MKIRYGLVAMSLLACGEPNAPPDLGPAKVLIESATADAVSRTRVTLTLRNDGGDGAFYVEIAGMTNVPGGSGPIARSESVSINAGYRETVLYDVSFSASVVRVYSRAANSASHTRTDCYYLSSNAHC